MSHLDFFTVDLEYINFLKKEETEFRGFSCVPNMVYSEERKQKFICGVVLNINHIPYFVPVTSYKKQQKNNILILADNKSAVGSLRFNFMFPVPIKKLKLYKITDIPDEKYRLLVMQERRFCIQNQDKIYSLAERTYKDIISAKNQILLDNSCDFTILESAYKKYCNTINLSVPLPEYLSISRRRAALLEEAYKTKNLNRPKEIYLYPDFKTNLWVVVDDRQHSFERTAFKTKEAAINEIVQIKDRNLIKNKSI